MIPADAVNTLVEVLMYSGVRYALLNARFASNYSLVYSQMEYSTNSKTKSLDSRKQAIVNNSTDISFIINIVQHSAYYFNLTFDIDNGENILRVQGEFIGNSGKHVTSLYRHKITRSI